MNEQSSLSTAEKLLHSVVRVESYRSETLLSTGTGFFVRFNEQGENFVPGLITNQHVIENADSIVFYCLRERHGKPSEDLLSYRIDIAKEILRPKDKGIDLCALSVGPVFNASISDGNVPFYCALPLEIVPTDDQVSGLDAIEDILMLGFPNGLTDQSSRLPLTRRGITATPPNRRFNGGREFLVDIACYPGSSGSPVFIFDRSSYFDRTTMSFKIGQRLLLVGILFAGPTINQAGSIVLDTVPSVQMSLMMHLGNCIDARVLFEFDEAIKNFQTG